MQVPAERQSRADSPAPGSRKCQMCPNRAGCTQTRSAPESRGLCFGHFSTRSSYCLQHLHNSEMNSHPLPLWLLAGFPSQGPLARHSASLASAPALPGQHPHVVLHTSRTSALLSELQLPVGDKLQLMVNTWIMYRIFY